jgi:RHS repeat-associated protein
MGWTYDPFGNRTSESVGGSPSAPMPSPSWASYTASNQASSVNGGAGLYYDAAGNMLTDPLNSYLYDAEGRLCAAKTAGPSYTGYVYDAGGTRVAKGSLTSFSCNFAPGNFTPTTSWVLGPGGEQVTEYAVSGGSSTWAHTNAFAGGKLLVTYTGADTIFALNDWLGTKRMEVGASGCASAYTGLAFGDGLTPVSVSGYASCPDATEHHFTGKERDTESGNDYFEARYYSSAMGRFMSPDWSAKVSPVPYAKLDFPQSLNLYAYVLNNPMTGIDKDGHVCGGAGQPACPSTSQPGAQLQVVKDLHAATSPVVENFSNMGAVEPSHASYSITTGQISLVDTDAGKSTVIGTGYSGKGDGLNNPSMENVSGAKGKPDAGPIPEGKYTIGKQQDNVTGSGTKLVGSERLTPQGGNEMFGRGGFLIHGDNAAHNDSASEGCIVTSRATRDAIGASGDRTLDVDR